MHGCSTALAEILRQIDPRPEDQIITLGDYVNRGPDTRGVIEQLLALRNRCRLIPLLGNHDKVLLDTLAGRTDEYIFERIGGQATLDSYGPGTQLSDLPAEHIAFLRSCRMCFETEAHLFAHAGYDPARPLSETDGNTLLWRKLEPPYPGPHYSGKQAIVGHTFQPSFQMLDLGHIVCIDTGCCRGGLLTALCVNLGIAWAAFNE